MNNITDAEKQYEDALLESDVRNLYVKGNKARDTVEKLYRNGIEGRKNALIAYKIAIEKKEDLNELAFLAADYAHAAALSLLFNAGVSPEITERDGANLLHVLAKQPKSSSHEKPAGAVATTVNLLLDNNVSASSTEKGGNNWTCYHYAAREGMAEFVEVLTQRGVKLDSTDKTGNNAIQIACSSFSKYKGQYFRLVKALVAAGVDPNQRNGISKSALNWAIEKNAKKIAAFLSGTAADNNNEAITVIGGTSTLYEAVEKNGNVLEFTMKPSKQWLKIYSEKQEFLTCAVDLNAYFTADTIAGKTLARLPIGKVSLPSGKIIVCDPLVSLGANSTPYYQPVPPGDYDVVLAVVAPDESGDCARYAAARVRFTDAEATCYSEALTGKEDLTKVQAPGDGFCFPVDAGLACICDAKTRDAFLVFERNWLADAGEDADNLYDDYFSKLMNENYKQNPQYQRENGDWLNWRIPDTEYHIPIFTSGFGDGCYPVWFGYDKDSNVCSLVVQFIDIEAAYTPE